MSRWKKFRDNVLSKFKEVFKDAIKDELEKDFSFDYKGREYHFKIPGILLDYIFDLLNMSKGRAYRLKEISEERDNFEFIATKAMEQLSKAGMEPDWLDHE